jgi:hypothetical protein
MPPRPLDQHGMIVGIQLKRRAMFPVRSTKSVARVVRSLARVARELTIEIALDQLDRIGARPGRRVHQLFGQYAAAVVILTNLCHDEGVAALTTLRKPTAKWIIHAELPFSSQPLQRPPWRISGGSVTIIAS